MQEDCGECFLGQDSGKMIVCQGCNTPFHLKCLDPPMDQDPEEDWKCQDCSIKRRKTSRRSDRRSGELVQGLPLSGPIRKVAQMVVNEPDSEQTWFLTSKLQLMDNSAIENLFHEIAHELRISFIDLSRNTRVSTKILKDLINLDRETRFIHLDIPSDDEEIRSLFIQYIGSIFAQMHSSVNQLLSRNVTDKDDFIDYCVNECGWDGKVISKWIDLDFEDVHEFVRVGFLLAPFSVHGKRNLVRFSTSVLKDHEGIKEFEEVSNEKLWEIIGFFQESFGVNLTDLAFLLNVDYQRLAKFKRIPTYEPKVWRLYFAQWVLSMEKLIRFLFRKHLQDDSDTLEQFLSEHNLTESQICEWKEMKVPFSERFEITKMVCKIAAISDICPIPGKRRHSSSQAKVEVPIVTLIDYPDYFSSPLWSVQTHDSISFESGESSQNQSFLSLTFSMQP